MKRFTLIFLFPFLISCAPTYTRMAIPLNPGGELEVVKAEPDWRSVVVVGIVKDKDGRIVGAVPGHGITRAGVAAALISSGAIVGGSLGGAAIVKKGLESISADTNINLP